MPVNRRLASCSRPSLYPWERITLNGRSRNFRQAQPDFSPGDLLRTAASPSANPPRHVTDRRRPHLTFPVVPEDVSTRAIVADVASKRGVEVPACPTAGRRGGRGTARRKETAPLKKRAAGASGVESPFSGPLIKPSESNVSDREKSNCSTQRPNRAPRVPFGDARPAQRFGGSTSSARHGFGAARRCLRAPQPARAAARSPSGG